MWSELREEVEVELQMLEEHLRQFSALRRKALEQTPDAVERLALAACCTRSIAECADAELFRQSGHIGRSRRGFSPLQDRLDPLPFHRVHRKGIIVRAPNQNITPPQQFPPKVLH